MNAQLQRVVGPLAEVDRKIDSMSRVELLELKAQVDDNMARIRCQLEEAKAHKQATGELPDPYWLQRARHALRMHGRTTQHIQGRLSVLRAEEKECAERDRQGAEVAFIRTAQRILDAETYQRIWDEARRYGG